LLPADKSLVCVLIGAKGDPKKLKFHIPA
jgi:hypothetical protein